MILGDAKKITGQRMFNKLIYIFLHCKIVFFCLDALCFYDGFVTLISPRLYQKSCGRKYEWM